MMKPSASTSTESSTTAAEEAILVLPTLLGALPVGLAALCCTPLLFVPYDACLACIGEVNVEFPLPVPCCCSGHATELEEGDGGTLNFRFPTMTALSRCCNDD